MSLVSARFTSAHRTTRGATVHYEITTAFPAQVSSTHLVASLDRRAFDLPTRVELHTDPVEIQLESATMLHTDRLYTLDANQQRIRLELVLSSSVSLGDLLDTLETSHYLARLLNLQPEDLTPALQSATPQDS